MNIVVLDGFTLNPGDLDWRDLEALGSCKIFDRTSPAEFVERAATANILVTNKALISGEHIRNLPNLKCIVVSATGTNVVDLVVARERGIPVANVPAYSTASVAQATFSLLLELTNRAGHHAQNVRDGRWSKGPDWCYWDGALIELADLTFGVVGYGLIGRAVAGLAAAFGMKVLVHASTPKSLPPGMRFVELETVFRESDVVSLHCPLTPQTKNLVNAQRLALMKPTAFLINTSRGPLIDELALAEALNAGRLAGAAMDVLSAEPPPENHPLLKAQNCIITPHIAWATYAARKRLMKAVVENVAGFLKGKPVNVVN